jgi:hypothetical protein
MMVSLSKILRMVGYRSVSINAPLPLADVQRRLLAKLDRTDRWISGFVPTKAAFAAAWEPGSTTSPHALSGNIRKNELWLHSRFSKAGSYQTWLFADMVASNDGTTLRVAIGSHPFVILFIALWLAFLLSAALNVWSDMSGGNVTLLSLFAIIVFGIASAIQARFLGRGEEKLLVDLLRQTVDA